MKSIDIKLSKQNICDDVAAELNLYGRSIELSATADGKEATNLQELANYIRTPDDNETKPVVARAMQEAWNHVKETCQRYFVHGRYHDDNRLEAIVLTENRQGIFDLTSYYDEVIMIDFAKNTTYRFEFDFTGCMSGSAGSCGFKIGNDVAHTFVLDENTEIIKFDYLAKEAGTLELKLVPAESFMEKDIVVSEPAYGITYNKYGEYNLQLSMPDNFNIGVTSSITSHAHRFIVDYIIAGVLKNQRQDGYAKYLTTAEAARKDLLRSLQARNSFGRVQHDWM